MIVGILVVMLWLLHRRIWRDMHRRAQKLLRFVETETDGGRDLVRAVDLTSDPLLRRLYLVHADDELRHGQLFRERGSELLRSLANGSNSSFQSESLVGSGHGVADP